MKHVRYIITDTVCQTISALIFSGIESKLATSVQFTSVTMSTVIGYICTVHLCNNVHIDWLHLYSSSL